MKKLLTILSLLLPLTVMGQSGQPWSALRETLVLSNSWIQAVAVPGVTNYKFTIGTLFTQLVNQVTLTGSATNAVTRGENLALTNATTFGVFYRVLGQTNMQFFTLKSGTNILMQRDGSNIVINSTPGSGSSVAAPLSSIQYNSNGVMQGNTGLLYTNGNVVLRPTLSGQKYFRIDDTNGTPRFQFGVQTNFPDYATLWLGNVVPSVTNYALASEGGITDIRGFDRVAISTGVGGSKWIVLSSGHLLAATDNFYDIGAPGATRPRSVYIGTMPGSGDFVAVSATGQLLRTNITDSSGLRIVAYEGDSLVNQALPVWPRSMDSNSVWFARSDVETNWGANGDTLQNMALTYPTQAHLNRPTNDVDEGLFLLHAGFNDYPIGRIDSQLYGDMTNIWGQARADKYKVVAMPIVGHTNLSAMVLSNLTLFDYLVRVDVMLANTNNTAMYYDTVHPTPAGANMIAKAVAAVVDGKPWMLVNTREETNASIPMIMDLILTPHGRYVGIGTPTPGATLHLRGTNAGQNVLRIDHSDGTPRFRFGTHQAGDQYATIWGSSPVPNGTNYILSANTNATVLNAADSVTVNVGHVVKIYTDSTGVYIPMSVGTGDHVAIRADGFLMRTNIVGGGGSSTQFVTATFGTATVTNTISAQTFNVQTGNFAFINLTNFLGSNQVRLGMQQLTNVHLTSLTEGNSLFWNATTAQWTNAPGGSGSGSGSTQMVTAAIGTLTQTNDISFVVSNQANVGSWAVPAKTNYANAFSAQGGGTNRLGETIFDNNVSVTSNLTVGVMVGSGDHVAVNSVGLLMRTNILGTSGPLRAKEFGVIGYTNLTLATSAAPQHVNMQALFNAAAATNGATVEFENGMYYYIGTNVSVFGDSVTVIGNGATILRDFHDGDGGSQVSANSAFTVTRKAGTGSNYETDWSKSIRFEGFIFRNIGATNGTVSDPGYFTNLNGVAVQYNRRQNKQVNLGSAIYIDQARGTEVSSCRFYECGHSVLATADSVTNAGKVFLANMNVSGCEIVDWGSVGISPGADSIIRDCSFIQSAPRINDVDISGTLGTSHAIYVSGGKANTIIEGCWIYGARYFGIQWYTSTAESAAGMVKNCHFIDCKYAGTVTADGGIIHNGFVFAGNYLTNCGLFAFGTTTSGSTNQLVIVQNNHWDSFSTNDGNTAQIAFRSGINVLQNNVFSGAYSPDSVYVVVRSSSGAQSFKSTGNSFLKRTNHSAVEITGIRFYDAATNIVIDVNGDYYETSVGIRSFDGTERWRSMTVRNSEFNCSVVGVDLAHGSSILNNYFLLNHGGYGIRSKATNILSPTLIQGNTFVNVPGSTPLGAIGNYDAATNQLVVVNNYFGQGVLAGSQTTAADMALFKPAGLFNGDLYGSNAFISSMVGTGDHVAINAAGKLMRTNISASGFGAGHSNAIPFINGAGTSYTYYDTGTSLTNPGFGFNPQTVNGPQAGYGGLMVFANESMGLVTIGHPNPGADFSTFTTALVVSNRYNSAANFKNDMVKIDAVMVGGGLQGDSTMTRWRVWQGTTSSNDVAEITIGGQMKLFGGTLYPTNVAASLPSATTLGVGGHWVGNSNGVLVALKSANGTTTTMTVLVP